MLMETRRAVIVKAAQITYEFPPDIDVRAAEVPQTAPDIVRPFQRRKRRWGKTRECRFVCSLSFDNRSKEFEVLGLIGYECDLAGNATNGHRHPATRHSTKG